MGSCLMFSMVVLVPWPSIWMGRPSTAAALFFRRWGQVGETLILQIMEGHLVVRSSSRIEYVNDLLVDAEQ